MAVMTDAFAENPLITSVVVNMPEDALDITSDCGNVRCGGFGDFIDVELDDEGRPWIALAHNAAGTEEAVIGTLMTGPALYGELVQLPDLPADGSSIQGNSRGWLGPNPSHRWFASSAGWLADAAFLRRHCSSCYR